MEDSVTAQQTAAPETPMLVAIDGPAGSGKSSVSRAVAEQLSYGILDTGAAYRALAWAALEQDVNLDDPIAVEEVLDDWGFSISLKGAQVVIVCGADATHEIRDPGVSKQVSRVSQHAGVRERLNRMFLDIVAESGLPGVVIEGRDITTVVAPNAPVRILMTASPEVRAKRRTGELSGSSEAEVLTAILERDTKDQLVVDFMNPAPGVTLIDTTELDFAQSVQAVIDVVQAAEARA